MSPMEGFAQTTSSSESISSKEKKLTALLSELTNQDPHERLGVPKSATAQEITDAFRRKANAYHPDRQPMELRDLCTKIFQLYSDARDSLNSQPSYGEAGNHNENNESLVKNQAFDDIIKAAEEGPEKFKSASKKWLELGILDINEISGLEQIKNIALKKILEAAEYGGGERCEHERSRWSYANIPIPSLAEIPGIKQIATKRIEDARLKYPHKREHLLHELYSWVRAGVIEDISPWINAGIISKKESTEYPFKKDYLN